MRRRTFILTTSTAFAGTVIGSTVLVNYYKTSNRRRHSLMHPLILSGICDEESIRKIGLSYRVLVPNENSKEKLMELLSSGLSARVASDSPELTGELEQKIEQEFKEDQVLIINGWVITPTEARQCALLTLSQ